MRRLHFFSAIFFASVLTMAGCGSNHRLLFKSSSPYHNEEYGFSIAPPPGWSQDLLSSQVLTEEVRRTRKEKDATVINFKSSKKVEESKADLTLIFTPGDSKLNTVEGRRGRLEELKFSFGGDRHLYRAEEQMIDGQPAVLVVACLGFEGNPDCRLVNHVTEIFTPEAHIVVHFTASADSYPDYKKAIEKSIESIRVNARAAPGRTARCRESDIEVIEHYWRKGGRFQGGKGSKFPIDVTEINWEAKLKNTGQSRCLVKVSYRLLDAIGDVLFDDFLSPPEIIEPGQEKKFMNYQEKINTDDLPKVHSSQVVISEIK